MREIAEYLEKLAACIHNYLLFKDNQSTTTLAYLTTNRTLYIASQGDAPVIGRALFKTTATTHAAMQKSVARGTYGGYKKTTLADPVAALLADIRGGLAKIVDDAERVRAEQAVAAISSGMPEELDVAFLKWVTRLDLVEDPKSFNKVGFHGESYIVRFLALKLHRVQALPRKPVGTPQQEDNSEEIARQFRDQYERRLAIASSQGACSSCAAFLQSVGVQFASRQERDVDRADTWKHPFSMRTSNAAMQTESYLWLSSKKAGITNARIHKRTAAGSDDDDMPED